MFLLQYLNDRQGIKQQIINQRHSSENTNLPLYQVLFVHPIHGMAPSSAVNSNPLPTVALSPAEALSACSVLVGFSTSISYQQACGVHVGFLWSLSDSTDMDVKWRFESAHRYGCEYMCWQHTLYSVLSVC